MTAPALLSAARSDLCLDFANTLDSRGSDAPVERLTQPADLLAWCATRQTLDHASLERFAESWRLTPRRAAAALSEAIAVREAIARIFGATASGAAPATADLARLNAALAESPARTALRPGARSYGWQVEKLPLGGAALLAPVLWSAGDLLTGARLDRVRQCANEKCRWFFLDESKAGGRRWCSMSSCGNRAKAHRHYRRQREGQS